MPTNSKIISLLPWLAIAPLMLSALLELREDFKANAAVGGTLIEVGLIAASILIVAIYWIGSSKNLRFLTSTNRRLKEEILISSQEALKWKQEADDALQSLSRKIDQQFSRWSLSPAEKYVALELLKGLSHKEIANERDSSEKTVRLQATSVYRKAGIEGRAQLAAFFLQGLNLSEHVK